VKDKKQTTFKLDETQKLILKVISEEDTLRDGLDIAITWARHFYQLGLRPDDPLDCVGLAIKTHGEPMTWDEYHNSDNDRQAQEGH
jgi:hypothetical protein